MKQMTKSFTKADWMLLSWIIEQRIFDNKPTNEILSDEGFKRLVYLHWEIARKSLPEVCPLPKKEMDKLKKKRLAEFKK